MRYLLALILCVLPLLSGCTMPDQAKLLAANETKLQANGIVALQPGDSAPEFAAASTAGNRVTLGAAGQPPAVLVFIPAAFTPNSTHQLLELSAGLERFAEAGLEVYGIATASESELARYAEQYDIAVPLLADTGQVAVSYGTASEDGMQYPQRTIVGIRDGEIALYQRGKLNVAQILTAMGSTANTPAPSNEGS